jgi:transposase-like protein
MTDNERSELKAQLRALLLVDGVTVKAAAKALNISRKTVHAWINEDGYRAEYNKCMQTGVKKKRDYENVSHFVAAVRVKGKAEWKQAIKEAHEWYQTM